MRLHKTCLACQKPLSGRLDKKFCDVHCKSNFQYQKARNNPSSFFNQVDKQLKLNRRILKTYNKAGKATVRKQVLIEKGFNPKFFTHYCRNGVGKIKKEMCICSVMNMGIWKELKMERPSTFWCSGKSIWVNH